MTKARGYAAGRLANTLLHPLGLTVKRLGKQGRKDVLLQQNLARFVRNFDTQTLPARETVLTPRILIPSFNHGRFLPDAIGSVAGSGIPITVIDDASTDDTKMVVSTLSEKADISYLRNEQNLRQWGSLNHAIEASDETLFIVLNADDAMLPWATHTILKIWQEHPDMRMLGGQCIPFNYPDMLRMLNYLPATLEYIPSLQNISAAHVRKATGLNDINMAMSSFSFVRSAWTTVGGFRPFEHRVVSHDDRDFQYRVAALFGATIMEEPLALWRQSSSTLTGSI